jgi:hypothetical protein
MTNKSAMIQLSRSDRWGVLYARIALGAAFLSAVAGRFGLWQRRPGMKHFADFIQYTLGNHLKNRPYVITSKPANRAEPGTRVVIPREGCCCKCSVHQGRRKLGTLAIPGRRVRQRRDATGAPIQEPEWLGRRKSPFQKSEGDLADFDDMRSHFG